MAQTVTVVDTETGKDYEAVIRWNGDTPEIERLFVMGDEADISEFPESLRDTLNEEAASERPTE